jgi:hypothetical protein
MELIAAGGALKVNVFVCDRFSAEIPLTCEHVFPSHSYETNSSDETKPDGFLAVHTKAPNIGSPPTDPHAEVWSDDDVHGASEAMRIAARIV